MQRQAMGVALHIVLLPFLNYCIAQLIRTTPALLSRLFFALSGPASTLTRTPDGFWPLTLAGTPVSLSGRPLCITLQG
ncbi:hypothetical protein D0S46_14740 [Klebsiella pneumoniae subsp. pneumoniae]|uniref:Uncharacterized protein n=1 Tax=Klebsiella pneumoniae TaxID=573 RepID=A0A202LCZ7_KLEPN|nr:hypothetical protein AM447_00110 [Klebsiella pneumoniae]AXQ43258.1 hypothetical protein D0S46_14740 [Klebsiella pneumoniae subsp. pneumoniae]ART11429.1 hypothetical protein B8F96_12785 [Klebsiella pneumoniae]ARX43971.1 hypothetical protein AM390_09035 [Klebsiella pneumoniae]AVF10311.1 hypothetical protein AM445_03780 [Klebsiella pneumoniae]